MIQFLSPNELELEKLVSKIAGHKHLYNNYFGIDLTDVSYCLLQNTLVFRKPYQGFDRVYMISDDKCELQQVLTELPDNCIFNIPSRTGHEVWNELIEGTGYSEFDTFEHLTNRTFESSGISEREYANEQDIHELKERILKCFSPLTGYLPTDEELMNLIKESNILIMRDNNEIRSALCMQFIKNMCYWAFWFSTTPKGINLLYTAFDICKERGVKNVTHWVRKSNQRAKVIYEFLGDTYDGLVDITYTKNSFGHGNI